MDPELYLRRVLERIALGPALAKRGMIATTQCFPETPVSCRA
jgi:hypothetical protein